MTFPYVVIGGGVAGVSCVRELCESDTVSNVVLISSSEMLKGIKNHVQVGKVLESFDVDEVHLRSLESEYEGKLKVIFAEVRKINPKRKLVLFEDSSIEPLRYEKICICTGSYPRTFIDHPLVHGIRDVETIESLARRLSTSRRAVLIGNGGIAMALVTELAINRRNQMLAELKEHQDTEGQIVPAATTCTSGIDVELIWGIKDEYIGNTFFDASASSFLLHSNQGSHTGRGGMSNQAPSDLSHISDAIVHAHTLFESDENNSQKPAVLNISAEPSYHAPHSNPESAFTFDAFDFEHVSPGNCQIRVPGESPNQAAGTTSASTSGNAGDAYGIAPRKPGSEHHCVCADGEKGALTEKARALILQQELEASLQQSRENVEWGGLAPLPQRKGRKRGQSKKEKAMGEEESASAEASQSEKKSTEEESDICGPHCRKLQSKGQEQLGDIEGISSAAAAPTGSPTREDGVPSQMDVEDYAERQAESTEFHGAETEENGSKPLSPTDVTNTNSSNTPKRKHFGSALGSAWSHALQFPHAASTSDAITAASSSPSLSPSSPTSHSTTTSPSSKTSASSAFSFPVRPNTAFSGDIHSAPVPVVPNRIVLETGVVITAIRGTPGTEGCSGILEDGLWHRITTVIRGGSSVSVLDPEGTSASALHSPATTTSPAGSSPNAKVPPSATASPSASTSSFSWKRVRQDRTKPQPQFRSRWNRPSKHVDTNPMRPWALYVRLSNGREYGCDMIISATGVVPNTSLFPKKGTAVSAAEPRDLFASTDEESDNEAEKEEERKKRLRSKMSLCNWDVLPTKLEPNVFHRYIDGGVLVNRNMQTTGSPDVYAAGDCATLLWPRYIHQFERDDGGRTRFIVPSSHWGFESLAVHGGFKKDREAEFKKEEVASRPREFPPYWFQMRLWSQAKVQGAYAARCMMGTKGLLEEDGGPAFELFAHMTNFGRHKVVLLGLYNGQGLDEAYADALKNINIEVVSKEYALDDISALQKEQRINQKFLSSDSPLQVQMRMSYGEEYIKLVFFHGALVGAMLIGDTGLEETCENLILSRMDLRLHKTLAEEGKEPVYNIINILNPEMDIEDFFD